MGRSSFDLIPLHSLPVRITIWVYTENLSIEPRYDIYASLKEVPRYWAVPNPPTGFLQAYGVYQSLNYVITLRKVYFTIQGIK